MADRRPPQLSPLALTDSSGTALQMVGDVLPTGVVRDHMDLMNQGFRSLKPPATQANRTGKDAKCQVNIYTALSSPSIKAKK